MTSRLLGLTLLGFVVCGAAYRLDRSGETLTADKRDEFFRCQYSSTPSAVESGRPPHSSLVAVCPTNSLTDKCLSQAKSSAHRVVTFIDESIGVADCEGYCDMNMFMGDYKNKVCLGYVTRNPFNDGLEQGKAQCWLIHGDAKLSSSFKDEVKIERKTLVDGRNTKLTHIKESCGAEARVVHFKRPEFRTTLALKRHELAQLRKAALEERNAAPTAVMKLKEEVKNLELEELKYKRLENFEGIYDWLPIRFPHRIAKGAEKVLPLGLVRLFKPGLIRNQQGIYRNYWQAPVRIRKIYKKSDLSAFLYLCLDKKSNEEAWYLATKEDPITWAGQTFRHLAGQSDDAVSEALKDAKFLQKAFFRLACVGTKIEKNNTIFYKAPRGEVRETVDLRFLDAAHVAEAFTKQPSGAFENYKKAEEALEESVLAEVGSCPVEGLTNSAPTDESKIGLSTFWSSEDFMEKMGAAQWLVDRLSKPDMVSKAGVQVMKWVSRGYSWWRGDQEQEEAKKLHDYSHDEIKKMMARMATLLKGASKLFLVMEAAGNTEDQQIKAVCAKEVLNQIFECGGLMPKVSQNLAMRPDIVKDDFVRNKLKETQNANPSRDELGTMQYMKAHAPTIHLKSLGIDVPLLEILEYSKALSAGSVGQVDLFRLRKDAAPEKAAAFIEMMPPGRGEQVIVKTVFEETEMAYGNDWNLLELFFTNCGDSCDEKMRVMWKILKPMEKSIFDEFNLTDEAAFTARGQEMLAEFTKNIEEGAYASTLAPGSIKLTTPNVVATSSKYILVQSLAGGTPLKNFLEDSVGQIERIVEWRSIIYSSILMVYGHMVIKHGFFQSDPHNGNWFWEPETKTVTLIDWGGVGQLDQATHCKLSNLYSHLGKLTEAWNTCESVEVSGFAEIAGTYRRAGFSIYQASEEEEALIYGRTYGVSYFNEATNLRLLYSDEGRWKIVRELPGKQELSRVVAFLTTDVTKMLKLSGMAPQKWTFVSEKGSKSSKEVTVKMKDPKSCNLPSRSKAYSLAALKLGLGLSLSCKAEDLVIIPEAPFTEDEDAMATWIDNGKRQISCLTHTEDETFIEWGLYTKVKLMVDTKDGMRFVKMPDNKTYNLDEVDYTEEKNEGWVTDAFDSESLHELAELSDKKSNMVLNTAQSQQALATSLYDSDILMAAVLGLGAKSSVGVVVPDVPDEYVLLARCILVFHGMLGDVLKENFVRLLVTNQQDYIQWLVRSGGDRFFRSWLKPAEEYNAQGKCQAQAEEWKQLEVPR